VKPEPLFYSFGVLAGDLTATSGSEHRSSITVRLAVPVQWLVARRRELMDDRVLGARTNYPLFQMFGHRNTNCVMVVERRDTTRLYLALHRGWLAMVGGG